MSRSVGYTRISIMLNIKTRFHLSWRRCLAILALGLLITISIVLHVPAQAVVRSYKADSNLDEGTIVAVSANDASKVEPVTSKTVDRMRGVVVNPSQATVTLSAPNQNTFVATTGRFSVLVSNQNGPVKAGDFVSISAMDGVGMLAQRTQPLVIAKAVSGFDGKSGVLHADTAHTEQGDKAVSIGRIEGDIGIIRNPLAITKTNLPPFLQSASTAIAGKSVSAARVYLAMALLLISGIIGGSLLYGGAKSSITAIGRNPLSKRSILIGLLKVALISFGIFIGGLFGVYLLLKL